jgi:hypothetical protein
LVVLVAVKSSSGWPLTHSHRTSRRGLTNGELKVRMHDPGHQAS